MLYEVITYMSIEGRVANNEDGEFLYANCILNDITESIRAKDKLKRSETYFRSIFEHSAVGISITRLDGSLRSNKAFCEILGYSEDELTGLNWRTITHPDDVALNEQYVQQILVGEIESARWEKRYIHKNGEIIWVDISTVLQRDSYNFV